MTQSHDQAASDGFDAFDENEDLGSAAEWDERFTQAPLYRAEGSDYDGDQFDLSDRAALRRVAGLGTELEDVTEVEYRQLRLERVVLVGVWTDGTAADA